MKEENLKALNELNYAPLSNNEEGRLRELEKSFNEEFNTDYYFMVMKRDK